MKSEAGRSESLLFHAREQPFTLGQEVEATLHCIMSIQEAVPLEFNQHLSLLFGPEILGQLPTSAGHRVQRTMLGLIGICLSYAISAHFFSLHLEHRFLRLMVHNPSYGLKPTPTRSS